jgi:uncharacterized protein
VQLAKPLSDAELEELDYFLESDAVPEYTMNLSMVHGFLTALAAGPTVVRPSEWLAERWRDDGQKFDSTLWRCHQPFLACKRAGG